MKISLVELEQQLQLLKIFKEKRPNTFFDAYKIALENNVSSSKVINNALELFHVEMDQIKK